MTDLIKAYNLGIKEESDGEFYSGNNREKIREEAKKAGFRNIYSYMAKTVKKAVLKEFGVKINARVKIASMCAEINLSLEAPFDCIYKKWDELNEEEKHEANDKSCYCQPSYCQFCYKCDAIGVKPKIKQAIDFALELLDSYNYDHTGKNPSDSDYCDRDFYERFDLITKEE